MQKVDKYPRSPKSILYLPPAVMSLSGFAALSRKKVDAVVVAGKRRGPIPDVAQCSRTG